MPLKRADLHLHTRHSKWKTAKIIKASECYTDPLEAYRRCKAAGMDFVAFTDHDTIDGALDLLSRRPDLAPEVIVGEEVETRFRDTDQWIHINVFDIDEAIHRDIAHLRGDALDLVGYLRQRGLFHVLNHPFQSYNMQQPAMDYIERVLDLFDFFEVGNGTQSSRHNLAVAEMLDYAAARGSARKHGVGGSDAHNLHNIGLYCTEAPVDGAPGEPQRRQWLAAVARGEGRAVGKTLGALGLMANVYRIIGQYYFSLRQEEVRRQMRPINYLGAAALAPVCVAGLPALLSLGNSLRLETFTAYLRRSLARRQRDLAATPAASLVQDPLD
jgi:predicted metal-dependent phosphoesterase TrpH